MYIKGNCIDCMYADVTRILRHDKNNYVSEVLAHAYNLHVRDFFVGTFGGLPPPPPIPKCWLRYWVQGPMCPICVL